MCLAPYAIAPNKGLGMDAIWSRKVILLSGSLLASDDLFGKNDANRHCRTDIPWSEWMMEYGDGNGT